MIVSEFSLFSSVIFSYGVVNTVLLCTCFPSIYLIHDGGTYHKNQFIGLFCRSLKVISQWTLVLSHTNVAWVSNPSLSETAHNCGNNWDNQPCF